MISIAIITKNEEKNILDCVESVMWADEIIVVDDFSEDRTLEVLEKLNNKKIKIYKRKLDNNFSSQRNFALSKARFDWVLFIDADEIVPTKLRMEINQMLTKGSTKINGFYIKRKDFMWGKKLNHGENGNISLLRLGRKNAGCWIGRVHEIWDIKSNTMSLENELWHFPHQTITEFLKEINFYTTIRAKELFEDRVKTNLFEIIFYPSAKFFKNYLLKMGFLDGIEGFMFAILMSIHSFLVRGKLWLLWKKN